MVSSNQLLVFDLDGTLVNSSPDIILAVNATLAELHLCQLPESLIISFVGEGSGKLLAKCLQYLQCFEEKRLREAIDFFSLYYTEHISDYSYPYLGVEETLSLLPYSKAVLTNKPSSMAVKLLNELNLDKYFTDIIGGDCSDDLKPNPKFLMHLMHKYCFLPSCTWMIGDSPIDIQTATNAGTKSIGALYGFIPSERVRQACPDYTISAFSELPGIIT